MHLVGQFTARPKSKSTGKPMAVATIKTVFQQVKALLDTLEDAGWQCPGWRKLFRIRWASLLTAAEQRKQAAGKDTFTDGELAELYAQANDRTKLFILLGLNCGMAQTEISTLQRADIDLKSGVIDRVRNKTRATAAVRARWQLWPETLQFVNWPR